VIARSTCYDDGFEWIELSSPTAAELADVAKRFRLHPLAVEDVLHSHQRAKLARHDSTWFAVLKTAEYLDSEEVVDLEEVMLFVGPTFFISIENGDDHLIDAARKAFEEDPQHLVLGPFAALYAVLDQLIEQYGNVVDSVAVDIDEIQGQVFSGERRNHAERIFKLKREVLEFRQAISPLTTGLDPLPREPTVIPEPLHVYYRDVIGHAQRLSERINAYDALLSDALHANAAVIGTRQNEDMRKISAWVAIISVPTMIAGVYGMNFENMPELRSEWGYPIVLTVMVTACFGLFRLFRRRGWL
jgi:magnesium transporter